MTTITVCYDGSPGAQRAVEAAGKLFPGARAAVAHAWNPPYPYGGIGYGGQVVLPPEVQRDLASGVEQHAQNVVQQGVELARAGGLDAHAEVREAGGPVWSCLLGVAEDTDSDAIVVGSRGFGELRALVLGSISTALAHHAHRPLVIVPAEREQ